MAPSTAPPAASSRFDGVTLDYMRKTNRPADVVDRCERYYKAQGLWRTDDMADPSSPTRSSWILVHRRAEHRLAPSVRKTGSRCRR